METIHENWPDIVTAMAAVIALVLSVFSIHYTRASLSLSKEQDRRRLPRLTSTFLQGDYTADVTTGARVYRFEISVNNPTDSDNALVRAELRLTYRLKDGIEMTARLGQIGGDGQLRLPMRIAAHEAVAGWCHFQVPSAIVTCNIIDQYVIELTDTHDQIASVTPLILSERPS